MPAPRYETVTNCPAAAAVGAISAGSERKRAGRPGGGKGTTRGWIVAGTSQSSGTRRETGVPLQRWHPL